MPLTEKEIIEIKGKCDCNIFVETGTGDAETIFNVAHLFDEIHSTDIVKSYKQYSNITKLSIADYKKVELYSGDSVNFLRVHLPKIIGNAIFYLDAYPTTETDDNPNPLFYEIDMILSYRPKYNIIVIDQAHYTKFPPNDYRLIFEEVFQVKPTIELLNDKIVFYF